MRSSTLHTMSLIITFSHITAELLREVLVYAHFSDWTSQVQVCRRWRLWSVSTLQVIAAALFPHCYPTHFYYLMSPGIIRREGRLLSAAVPHYSGPELNMVVRLQIWCAEWCRRDRANSIPICDIVRRSLGIIDIRLLDSLCSLHCWKM